MNRVRPPGARLDDMSRAEWLKTATGMEIERWVDQGFRHKQDVKIPDVHEHWNEVGRALGNCVSRDPYSFSEFEKHLAIMVKRLVLAERALKKLAGDENFRTYRNRLIGEG